MWSDGQSHEISIKLGLADGIEVDGECAIQGPVKRRKYLSLRALSSSLECDVAIYVEEGYWIYGEFFRIKKIILKVGDQVLPCTLPHKSGIL